MCRLLVRAISSTHPSNLHLLFGKVASYKSQIFANMRGKAETVLEIGIGTGPNLKYYAGDNSGVRVFGMDPNRKMEKYAQAAALNAGLPPADFKFIHAVVCPSHTIESRVISNDDIYFLKSYEVMDPRYLTRLPKML